MNRSAGRPRRWRSVAGPVAVALALGAAACTADDPDPVSAPSSTTTAPVQVETPEGSSTTVASDPDDESSAPGPWDIDATLAADPNCSNPVGGDPLIVGYAADLSEIGGPADRPGSQAAVHLADLINCSGGLDGRPVEVIVADVSGDAASTRATVLDLIDQGVHVLLGPPFGDYGFRVLQVTKGDIAVLFTGSTEPALADSELLAYLVAFNDTQGATVAAEFALLRGWETAVTFSSQGPYFGYNSIVFREAFRSRGGTILDDFAFIPLETEDFSEAVAAIAENPPEVIYSPMFASQMTALGRQLAEAEVEVELLQSDAFDATGGYTLADTEGIFHVTHGFPAEDSRIVALEASMTAASGVAPSSANFAALAGDAMAVIIAAYFASGRSDDPAVLGAAIATVSEVEGITGTLSYDGTGLPMKPIYVHEVVEGEPSLAMTAG